MSSLSGACATQASHHSTEGGIRKSESVQQIWNRYWNVLLQLIPLVLMKLLLTDRYTPEVKNSHHYATFNVSHCGSKWLGSVERTLWQEEHKWPLLTGTHWVHSVQVRLKEYKGVLALHNTNSFIWTVLTAKHPVTAEWVCYLIWGSELGLGLRLDHHCVRKPSCRPATSDTKPWEGLESV